MLFKAVRLLERGFYLLLQSALVASITSSATENTFTNSTEKENVRPVLMRKIETITNNPNSNRLVIIG